MREISPSSSSSPSSLFHMAEMASERSRTLHNFALPPRLNWGTQKHLRCSNLQADVVFDPTDRRRRSDSSSIRRVFPSDADNQIDAIGEKLILDLRSEADKMRATILCPNPPPPPPPLPQETRPWILRSHRAACKEPSIEAVTTAVERGRSGVGEAARAKFAVALSRQEIEDDFLGMAGRRPYRKPKKRPRYVQKQMDTLFPGLWLSEITADMYKVNDDPEPAK